MKLSIARVSVSSLRSQTCSRIDLRETTRPALRIRCRNSSASISVSWIVPRRVRNSSVEKSIDLPSKRKTSSGPTSAAAGGGADTRGACVHWLRRRSPSRRASRIEFEGLGQIVVSPRGKPFQHVLGAAARGQNQHRHIVFGRAQFGGHLKSVFAGQHDIEHYRIETFFSLQ